MCNLATTILNFGLALGARPSLPKIQNCGSNECLISDTCYTIRRETSPSAYNLTKLCYFLFEFNKNWRSCRYLCVVKLHEVSLTLNEKQNFFFDNTFNERSIR